MDYEQQELPGIEIWESGEYRIIRSKKNCTIY